MPSRTRTVYHRAAPGSQLAGGNVPLHRQLRFPLRIGEFVYTLGTLLRDVFEAFRAVPQSDGPSCGTLDGSDCHQRLYIINSTRRLFSHHVRFPLSDCLPLRTRNCTNSPGAQCTVSPSLFNKLLSVRDVEMAEGRYSDRALQCLHVTSPSRTSTHLDTIFDIIDTCALF